MQIKETLKKYYLCVRVFLKTQDKQTNEQINNYRWNCQKKTDKIKK